LASCSVRPAEIATLVEKAELVQRLVDVHMGSKKEKEKEKEKEKVKEREREKERVREKEREREREREREKQRDRERHARHFSAPSVTLPDSSKESEKENLRERIVHEVEQWAKGRSIKSMLNELNGLNNLNEQGYLKRGDTFKEVSRSYKRALLKIHPDKHMDNETKHIRATEVFKYVSHAYNEYKKKYER